MAVRPDWTAWAKAGEEHDFMVRQANAAKLHPGTLYVDGKPYSPRELVLEPAQEVVDATTYGDLGKTVFGVRGRGMLEATFAEGQVEVEVLGPIRSMVHDGTDTRETAFRGMVVRTHVDLLSQGRTMRDSPPSEDVLIPCIRCKNEYPSAEVSWTSDPYASEIHDDTVDEGWWCRDCFQAQVDET